MAVRTKELGALKNFTANVRQTLYTCPAGKTAILKHVTVNPVGTVTWILTIIRGGVAYTLDGAAASGGLPVQRVGWFVVLEPGDDLGIVFTTTSGSHNAMAYGAELDGVA